MKMGKEHEQYTKENTHTPQIDLKCRKYVQSRKLTCKVIL